MSQLPKITPDYHGMALLGDLLKEMLPENVGFTLLTFINDEAGTCNYISSANRSDMINGLRKTADRLASGGGIITTPNPN
jgi:hypothetical protein